MDLEQTNENELALIKLSYERDELIKENLHLLQQKKFLTNLLNETDTETQILENEILEKQKKIEELESTLEKVTFKNQEFYEAKIQNLEDDYKNLVIEKNKMFSVEEMRRVLTELDKFRTKYIKLLNKYNSIKESLLNSFD